jgi:hypothetical protein
MASSVDQLSSTDAAPPATEAAPSSALQIVGPAGFVLFVLLLATAFDGGFDLRQWAPPAVFAVVALAAIAARGGGVPLGPWGLVTVGGAWGLATWSVLSATWATSAGDALEGAGRDVLYAAVITLPLVAIPHRRALRFAGGGVIVGITALAIGTLGAMVVDGPAQFLAGRLDAPVGYRNATALLFAIGFWPLIAVAAERGRARWLKAGAFAVAVLCLGLAFLTQSRGVVLGVACGGIVSGVLPPDRVRRIWLAIGAVGLVALTSKSLLTPYDAFDGGQGVVTSDDIATATRTLLLLLGGAFAAGLGWAVFDNGLRAESAQNFQLRRVARVGLVVVAVLGVVGGLAVVGNPVTEVQQKWDEFRANETIATGSTRLTNAGGQRYDLWRVALLELKRRPVGGSGRDNYQYVYYRERDTDRNLDTAHGLLFEVGAELGVVGLLLLVVLIAGLAGMIASGWRRTPPDDRRLAGGLAAAGAVLLGQSMVDWIWRIPGVTSIGLFALATAAALVSRSALPATRPVPLRLPMRVAVGGALVVAGFGLASMYISDRYVRRARAATTAQERLDAARTAHRFNPFDVASLYLQASARETVGDRDGARHELLRALDREPDSAATLGLLGDLAARGGDFTTARVYYLRALTLNPKDVGLQQLAKTGGRPPAA